MMRISRTNMRGATTLVLLAAFALTAACGITLPGTGERSQLYVLTPKSTYPDDLPTVDWQLLVEKTTSPAGLDTPRIAVAYSPIELDYFARTNWTDRAPEMVLRLLVESFENSGKIIAVGRDSIGLRSNIVLKTELREFQAEYDRKQVSGHPGDGATGSGKAPQIRVRIAAKLVKMPQRIIVASQTFEHVAPAEENTMESIVGAFDYGLGKALKHIVIWTLTEGDKIVNEPKS
ncbi:MAG: membrane integrity-associated transporter subunit PqiC [Alphaproteobacteria bacterium]|nr:membrane integrity-associated transporter subunit PqiC [Alphaproteobacteria bacterium]